MSEPRAPRLPDGARDRALVALLTARQRFIHDTLDEMQRAVPISPADLALAHELALGVERRRLSLQRIVSQFAHGAWGRVDPRLRTILLIAAYQLLWHERIPDYAAVNEAVEQARHFVSRKAAGLVNAVLRALLRARGVRVAMPSDADPRRWVAGDAQSGFLFADPVWPDPNESAVQFLAQTTSHPVELVSRWVRHHGQAAAATACRAGAQRPPLVLRAQALRISPAALCDRFMQRGLRARLDAECGAIELSLDGPLAALPEFGEGLCQPQDATAQAVWTLRPPKPGERVLDLCAGSGTKATHAAELMGDRGLVAARCGPDAAAGERLIENARRLGLSSIRLDVAGAVQLGGSFDLILLDVPCSNTGTLARRPEARYRFAAQRGPLPGLLRAQDELLAEAARIAGPRTDLLYSTCSIEPEENEERVSEFCRRHTGWTLVASRLTLPDAGDEQRIWRDGGFVALLRRTERMDHSPARDAKR